MANTLRLLAYVPNLMPEARKYCARREGSLPYFREGFVDLDHGRHINWTAAIKGAIEGYAIADEKGVVQARYRTLERAVQARDAARPRFISDLDLDTDEDEVSQVAGATA